MGFTSKLAATKLIVVLEHKNYGEIKGAWKDVKKIILNKLIEKK